MNFKEDYSTPALFAWDKRALFGNYFDSLLSDPLLWNVLFHYLMNPFLWMLVQWTYKLWPFLISKIFFGYRYTLTPVLCGTAECMTFAPVTVAPMLNSNVKHNPNPNPTPYLNPYPTLSWTQNPIITLTLSLCCWRYPCRSNCRRSKYRITCNMHTSMHVEKIRIIIPVYNIL